MRAWWEMREPRERILLLVLGALVSLFIVIFAIVLPLQSARDNAQTALTRAQADLQLVNRIAPNLSGPTTNRAQFNRAALVRTAGERGIKLARMQPGENGALSVWIDEVSTESLYGLFTELMTNYTAVPERVSISADQNGTLSAQFTLRPA